MTSLSVGVVLGYNVEVSFVFWLRPQREEDIGGKRLGGSLPISPLRQQPQTDTPIDPHRGASHPESE
jgi:hypothetical protein